MDLSSLTAVSPIDGRYRSKAEDWAAYFSEWALIRYRVRIEVEYFIALCELPLPQLQDVNPEVFPQLRRLYEAFSQADAQAIKDIERTTNHDVKAVEYFLKAQFEALGLGEHLEFIHFALTSQDINNTALPLMLKEGLHNTYLPQLDTIIEAIASLADAWKDVPMLARTHGQPASPTILGKEMMVFVERLQAQRQLLLDLPHAAKFGGATGNFNAHHVTYPAIDWRAFANAFVNDTLGLHRSQWTTQIEHYDHQAALFQALTRINTILTDFARDMWTYISMDYFKQKVVANEVGSSAMPHKVNPIDFENAEGNFGLANALFEHLALKLPISRLQRDLTDSTVSRNVGVPLAHTTLAFKALLKGIGKLQLNADKLHADLTHNWAVVAEAIQNILRRERYPKPYEALKALTRGNHTIDQTAIQAFIETLAVSEAVKAELRAITPHNYIGIHHL